MSPIGTNRMSRLFVHGLPGWGGGRKTTVFGFGKSVPGRGGGVGFRNVGPRNQARPAASKMEVSAATKSNTLFFERGRGLERGALSVGARCPSVSGEGFRRGEVDRSGSGGAGLGVIDTDLAVAIEPKASQKSRALEKLRSGVRHFRRISLPSSDTFASGAKPPRLPPNSS